MKKESEEIMDSISEKWVQEQFEIASRVMVLDDNWDATKILAEDDDFRVCRGESTTIRYYGGVDVSFPENEDDPAVAVYVILRKQGTLELVYQDHEYFDLNVPYIPSFLAFREIDPLLRLVEKQRKMNPQLTPDIVLVDGNGLLHPRGAGIACFLGVRTGIPTIGIGKSLFCQGGLTKELVWNKMDQSLRRAAASTLFQKAIGRRKPKEIILFDKHPIHVDNPTDVLQKESNNDDDSPPTTNTQVPSDRGQWVQSLAAYCGGVAIPLETTLESQNSPSIVACVLVAHGGGSSNRLGCGTKVPIFVSVGHGLSLRKAVETTAILSIARIPEPVRQADLIGRRLLRSKKDELANIP